MAHFYYPRKKYMFTPEEKQALKQLLDLALKAGGLQVANDVLYFIRKLETPVEPHSIVSEEEANKIEPKTNKK